MTINDEILTLANQIANRGHKPTVALVKTKLKQKVPLPLIISTLKTWQHDPDYTSVPEEKQPSGIKKNQGPSRHQNGFEKKVLDELSMLKKEITALKLLVNTLVDQNSTLT